jgi:hypothetical protein
MLGKEGETGSHRCCEATVRWRRTAKGGAFQRLMVKGADGSYSSGGARGGEARRKSEGRARRGCSLRGSGTAAVGECTGERKGREGNGASVVTGGSF